MTRIAAIALTGAMALAACGKDAAAPVQEGNARAKGEVLGGSISDDMIPLDSVTSTSPPLRETASPTATATGKPRDAASVSVETPEEAPTGSPEPQAD